MLSSSTIKRKTIDSVFSCGLSNNRKVRFFFFFSFFLFFNPWGIFRDVVDSDVRLFSNAGHVFFSVKSLNSRNLVFFFLFLTFLQNRKFVYTTIHMFLLLVCYRCAVKIYRLKRILFSTLKRSWYRRVHAPLKIEKKGNVSFVFFSVVIL